MCGHWQVFNALVIDSLPTHIKKYKQEEELKGEREEEEKEEVKKNKRRK